MKLIIKGSTPRPYVLSAVDHGTIICLGIMIGAGWSDIEYDLSQEQITVSQKTLSTATDCSREARESGQPLAKVIRAASQARARQRRAGQAEMFPSEARERPERPSGVIIVPRDIKATGYDFDIGLKDLLLEHDGETNLYIGVYDEKKVKISGFWLGPFDIRKILITRHAVLNVISRRGHTVTKVSDLKPGHLIRYQVWDVNESGGTAPPWFGMEQLGEDLGVPR